jgi:hypothetical protein
MIMIIVKRYNPRDRRLVTDDLQNNTGCQNPASGSSKDFRSRACRIWFALLIPALIFALIGCATAPIGVTKAGVEDAYLDINGSVLNGRGISSDTKIVLHRYDLLEQFMKDPAAAIGALFKRMENDDRLDLRFALAEMCFSYGERLEKQARQFAPGDADLVQPWNRPVAQDKNKPIYTAADYYLMTAVFAYDYVLGPLREDSPDAYDRRYRVACDLYNFALGKGLATGKEGQLEFRSGVRELPLGRIRISLKRVSLQMPLEDFEAFLPVGGISQSTEGSEK